MPRSAMIMLLFLLTLSPAFADTYSWTDEQGTVHFTEDPGQVPKKLRGTVRRLGDDVPSPAEQPSLPATEVTPGENAPAAGKGAPAESYGGRSYAEWANELAEREAALNAIRKRTDDIRDILNTSTLKPDEIKRLMGEYRQLQDEFKTLKAEYYQRVEAARKAGLDVTIQK